jgi:hypothetical protein
MPAKDRLQSLLLLHAVSPTMLEERDAKSTRIEAVTNELLRDVETIFEAHDGDAELAAIMREHYPRLLLEAAQVYSLLKRHIHERGYPGDTLEGHMLYVLGVASATIMDLTYQLLAAFIEVAGILDGSIEKPREAVSLLAACRRVVANDPHTAAALGAIEVILRDLPQLVQDD